MSVNVFLELYVLHRGSKSVIGELEVMIAITVKHCRCWQRYDRLRHMRRRREEEFREACKDWYTEYSAAGYRLNKYESIRV